MAALLHRKPDMTPVTPAVIIHMTFVYNLEEQSLKWRYHVSETLVSVSKSAWCHNLEDHMLNTYLYFAHWTVLYLSN